MHVWSTSAVNLKFKLNLDVNECIAETAFLGFLLILGDISLVKIMWAGPSFHLKKSKIKKYKIYRKRAEADLVLGLALSSVRVGRSSTMT